MDATAIRADLPGTQRRLIDIGQIWVVDGEPGVRWFVLAPMRIIALFAGGADHTPASLVFTYGDRLRLEQNATVYADAIKHGRHSFIVCDERNEDYIALCQLCGETPLAEQHRDPTTNRLLV